jgi:para-nitrobenzyl esterase
VAPSVEIAQGRLSGFEDRGLQVYLGIPYAAPPTGPGRFRAPEPPEPWSGVRDGTRYGASAPQAAMKLEKFMSGFDVGAQSEDCLHLNVFTPGPGGRRPVMVWIHGGAFTLGSGSQKMYDLRRLARDGDLVCITLNYRLGALAFLHLAGLDPSLDTTACAGIQDQAAALRWVLLGLPEARGLFQRAIAQSGAAHWVNDAEAGTRVAQGFLDEAGLTRTGLEKLWELPWQTILAVQKAVEARVLRGTHSRPFRPVVDGRALPERPIDAIRSGHAASVPVVVGACRDEEKLFTLWDAGIREIDEAGVVKRADEAVPGHGRRLVEAYRQARAARGADTSPFEIHCAIHTDLVFRMPAVRLAEAQARRGADAFAYLVTWESAALGGKLGACHGIDLPFVLGQVGGEGKRLFSGSGPDAERLSREMMGAWIAFARSGDPNHPALAAWPVHDRRRRATMFFGRESAVVDAPLEAERRVWEGIL